MLKKFTLALTYFISLTSLIHARSLLPDLKTATSPLRNHRIDTSTIPGKVLFRFSNGVANIGQGRLELKGGEVLGNGTRKVYQRIYNTWGGYSSRLAGVFQHHPEHNHVHFNDFAHYKLREIIGTSGVGQIVAESDKVSFCLIDKAIYNSRLPYYSTFPRYFFCGTSTQGISVGWQDVYNLSLPNQWIDVTNVPSGQYWLESTVDPKNQLREMNESNNTTRIKVMINHPGILLGDR